MKYSKELEEYILKNRHYLHQHPELGFNCVNTHNFIREQLDLLGIKYYDYVGKYSIVGIIENGVGPIIGLRADFDALPIQEETNLEFKSVNKGIMHACGHDAHTSMLLGVAKYLSENKDKWHGIVKFIFQEAEEGPSPGGAIGIVKSGLLDDCDSFFAFHVSTSEEAGLFLINEGEALAAADTIKITFHGLGSHAAYPHLGIDPIIMQAEFISSVQTIISRKKSPMEKGVITIAKVKAGTTHNIIPDTAYLEGTVRTFSEDTRTMFEKEIKNMAKNIAKAHGGKANVNYIRGYNALINTKSEALKFIEAAKPIFGEENIKILNTPSMGAEDFSYYVKHRKGAMAWLGVGYKDRYNYPIHHSKMEVDESALINGCYALINLVTRMGEENVFN